MYTNPLADAIKLVLGSRKPQPGAEPFVPVIAEVWTEHSSMVSRLPEQFTIYLPTSEDIQMKDEDTQPMPVKPGDVRCTFVLTIRGHGDKPIEPVFLDCMERYVMAGRSGFLRCGAVEKYTFDFASREVFVSVESIK